MMGKITNFFKLVSILSFAWLMISYALTDQAGQFLIKVFVLSTAFGLLSWYIETKIEPLISGSEQDEDHEDFQAATATEQENFALAERIAKSSWRIVSTQAGLDRYDTWHFLIRIASGLGPEEIRETLRVSEDHEGFDRYLDLGEARRVDFCCSNQDLDQTGFHSPANFLRIKNIEK